MLFSFFILGCGDKDKKYYRPPDFVLQHLTVEVQPINGKHLDGKEVGRFKGEFQASGICAIESITLVTRPNFSTDKNRWTSQDLFDFKEKHQTLFDLDSFDDEMTVFMAHLSGNFDETSNVLGLAFGSDFIVFFDNEKYTNDFQSVVLMHELGHTLGLVDPNNRENPPVNQDAPSHCNTKDCVMFWRPNLLTSFDSLCKRDLQKMLKAGPMAATRCNCNLILK